MKNFFFAVCFLSSFAYANSAEDNKWAGNLKMNGYALEDYKNFSKDWELVTVRFRQDSGEFRFTYANPLAAKALKNNTAYPDGAIFAKTAYLLGSDTDFPSSLTPNKVNRYQLMVKNSKLHTETDGWGYVLFDPSGRTFPGEPRAASLACNACHQIVKDKGSVFSEFISKDVAFFTDPKVKSVVKKQNSYLPQFENIKVSQLPGIVQKNVPAKTKSVRSIKGDLKKFIFEGTLNEIRPFLAKESIASNSPALLLSEDKKHFSLVYQDKDSKGGCGSVLGPTTSMIAIVSTANISLAAPYADPGAIQGDVAITSFCFVNQ